MDNKKLLSKKNIMVFWVVSFFYLGFSLVNYFYSKSKGQQGLGGIISLGGGNDSYFYWQQVLDYFNNPKSELIETSIYVPLVANLVKFISILDPLVIKLFNYIGFIILIILMITVNKIIEVNGFKYRNKLSMLYLLMYPSMIFMVTTGIFRDVWIVVFQLLTSILYIRFFYEKEIVYLFFGGISNFILAEFRSYAGLAMLVSFLIIGMIEFVSDKRKKQIIILVGIIFVVWYTFFLNLRLPIVDRSLMDALEYRATAVESYSGGSSLGIRLDQSNILLFIINYLYSFLSNLIGPLVNQWLSISLIITGIFESIPMIYMIIIIVKNRHSLQVNSIYLLIFNVVWTGTIAITNDNIGTGVRLRLFTYISLMIVYLQVTYSKTKKFDLKK